MTGAGWNGGWIFAFYTILRINGLILGVLKLYCW